MDGITFGALYTMWSLMPFDLKLLPTEEVTTTTTGQGAIQQATRSWRLVKPGEVELIHRTPIGGILRTVFQVDGEGRIQSGAYYYDTEAAVTTTEFAYTDGKPTRVVWKTNGTVANENNYSWSNGELVRWSGVELPSRDSTYATFAWKAGRINTVHVYAEGGREVSNYTYPTADSAHVLAGPTEVGFRLKDGHILNYSRGGSSVVYRNGSEVGIRARTPVRNPARPPQSGFRDWLGRSAKTGPLFSGRGG